MILLLLIENWKQSVRALLSEHEYVDFLVGRDGEFDQFASSAVLRVRKQYRDDNSSLILVLPYAKAEYLNNEDSFHDYYSDVEISYEASKAHTRREPCRYAIGKWLTVPIL